jgi:RHS repeat-associated protein
VAVAFSLSAASLATSFPAVTSAAVASTPAHAFVPGPIAAGSRTSGAGKAATTQHEVLSRRGRNTRTFTTAAGFSTEIYGGSINYQDSQGTWQPINDTLVTVAQPGVARQNQANSYRASLPPSLSGPVTFSVGTAAVQVTLEGGGGTLASSGSVATYAHALSGADLTLAAEPDALKESIVLQSAAAPSTFTYDLQLSPGLTATLDPGGGVNFADSSGALKFSMLAPFMSDSSGTASAVSRAVTLQLSPRGSTTLLTISADRTWLGSPLRRYPVTIDPTISVTLAYYGGRDCYIQNTTPTTSYCSSAGFAGTSDLVGYDGVNVDRSLFNVGVEKGGGFSTYIPDSNILDAHFAFTLNSSSSSSPVPVSIYPITQKWSGLTPGHTATWNTTDGSTPWTTPGGTVGAVLNTQNVGPAVGQYEWGNLTQTIQSWVNGSVTDRGILIRAANESSVGLLQFNNGNAASGEPHLLVEWNNWNGQQRFFGYERQQLSDRMDLAVNDANGNLVLHSNDLVIKGTGLDLHLDRYYNSLSGETSHLGQGWTMAPGCDVFVEMDKDGISYEAPDGYAVLMRNNGSGIYTAPGMDADLVINQDGTYSLTFHSNGTKFSFQSGGCLQSVQDKNNNLLSLSYGGTQDDLQTITDTQGRATSFTYTTANGADVLQQIQDPAGRQLSYGYDANGNVNQYTDPMNQLTKYGYNSLEQVNQITDPNGNVTNITYSPTFPYQVTLISRQNSACSGGACTLGFTYNTGQGTCDASVSGDSVFGNTVVTDGNGNQTTRCFDNQGRVIQSVDAKGQKQASSYTSDNNVQTYADAANPSSPTQFGYDPTTNNLTSATLPTGANAIWGYQKNASTDPKYFADNYTDPQGNLYNYSYDSTTNPYPNLHQVQQGGSGPKWQATYNTNGTVATNTDANNHVTSYVYYSTSDPILGERSQLKQINFPVVSPHPLIPVSFTYDGLSRVATRTDAQGTQTYSYDALDRILQILYGGATTCTPAVGNCISYQYDADGNVNQLTDNTGVTVFTYDAMNRQKTKVLPGTGGTITYGYDNESNLTSLQDLGGTVTYGYDTVNELNKLTEPNLNVTTFDYNAGYMRLDTKYPNGVWECMSYDNSERLVTIKAVRPNPDCRTASATLNSFTYTYLNGTKDIALRSSVTDVTGVKTTYGYDALNQLHTASASSGSFTYGYDNNGNLTNDNGVTQVYNAVNELTSAGSTTYIYGGNGNEASSSSGWSFGYNTKNQTSSVTAPGQTAVGMSYTGGSQSERVSAGTSSYSYNVLGLGSQTAGTTSTYFSRDNRGSVTEERVGSSNYYYLFDGLGSVVGLADASGTLQNTYGYGPYGTTTSAGSVSNPLGFASGVRDPSGLVKFGMRFYTPWVGQWTQQDSVPAANRYAYVNGDPVNYSDPTGASFSWFDLGVAILGGVAAVVTVVAVFVTVPLWLGIGLAAVGVGIAGYTFARLFGWTPPGGTCC